MWNVKNSKEGFCTVSKRVPILGTFFDLVCPYLYESTGTGQIEAGEKRHVRLSVDCCSIAIGGLNWSGIEGWMRCDLGLISMSAENIVRSLLVFLMIMWYTSSSTGKPVPSHTLWIRVVWRLPSNAFQWSNDQKVKKATSWKDVGSVSQDLIQCIGPHFH